MTSYRIWIPSLQKYIRMYELNCEQFRNILKVVDENEELDFILNEILINNLYNTSYKLSDFTIIDKFVIFLQLRIRSCGSKLKLVRICDKCDERTDINIDLNDTINILSPKIDKSFGKYFSYPNIEIFCDLPSIKYDDNQNSDNGDLSKKIDNYLYSFIKTIKIKDTIINLEDLKNNEKIKVCESIPFSIINEIRQESVDVINQLLYETLFISNVCKNNNCKNPFTLNLDVNHINDIIRILFSDTSALNLLIKYVNLSTNSHLDFQFYKNISPAELDIISDMIQKSNSRSEEPSSKEVDLFEEYRNQTKDMKESPSEFD